MVIVPRQAEPEGPAKQGQRKQSTTQYENSHQISAQPPTATRKPPVGIHAQRSRWYPVGFPVRSEPKRCLRGHELFALLERSVSVAVTVLDFALEVACEAIP
jgi:hypothetical protein